MAMFRVVEDPRDMQPLPPWSSHSKGERGRFGVMNAAGEIVNPVPFSVKSDARSYAATMRRELHKQLRWL